MMFLSQLCMAAGDTAVDQVRTDAAFWNEWNAQTREKTIGSTERDQRDLVVGWVEALAAKAPDKLSIIDVGCGAGWLTPYLLKFGNVTGTDLSDEVLARSAQRWPTVKFVAGDFMALAFEEGVYDVIVTLEVIAHVPDQAAFVAKLARLLKPAGVLILATQNRRVLKLNKLAKAKPGQIRQHLDIKDLTRTLSPHFAVEKVEFRTPVYARRVIPDRVRRALSKGSRLVFRGAMERWLERRGLGWSIIVQARKL